MNRRASEPSWMSKKYLSNLLTLSPWGSAARGGINFTLFNSRIRITRRKSASSVAQLTQSMDDSTHWHPLLAEETRVVISHQNNNAWCHRRQWCHWYSSAGHSSKCYCWWTWKRVDYVVVVLTIGPWRADYAVLCGPRWFTQERQWGAETRPQTLGSCFLSDRLPLSVN